MFKIMQNPHLIVLQVPDLLYIKAHLQSDFNSIYTYIRIFTNVLLCIKRLFLYQHCVQIILLFGKKNVPTLCAKDFRVWYQKRHDVLFWVFVYTSVVSKFKILVSHM